MEEGSRESMLSIIRGIILAVLTDNCRVDMMVGECV